MGQAGSQPSGAERARRAHTLPHEPLRHAPKVLPSLTASPRLRSTDNGAILHSGGTISGRRPGPETRVPHGHVHSNVFRSRSAGGVGEAREPLHRSHTNLDIRHDGNSLNKRFGSEPDLRTEEEQKKKSNTRHFRKKYRAPQPPAANREGSSPDSRGNNTKTEPNKKLRLFRTRNESKQLNGNIDIKAPVYKSFNDFKSLETTEQLERRYKSLNKGKETHLQYPDNRDMVQSTASLKREERLLQARQDYKNARSDRAGAQRSKIPRAIEQNEAWKTPLINKNFRYSERFRKDENDSPVLRREKTFDSLFFNESRNDSPNSYENKNKYGNPKAVSPLGDRNQPLRKSLPSLLAKSKEVKDEFQLELKKATNKVKNELGDTHRLSDTKTSQHDKLHKNPTKNDFHSKVRESSLKLDNNTKQESKVISVNMRKPLSRLNDGKMKASPQTRVNSENSDKFTFNKENGTMNDRGQASGKESTPEHSPTRRQKLSQHNLNDRQKSAPSKQFYFGMIENKQPEPSDRLKDFPGLGTPIIEEFNNFHLIEKKLLGYHDEDEMEKFNEKLKVECKRNLSSESALSSDGSEGEGSDSSLGIALRLRPTMPKKMPNMPHFSPAAAWRQLASLDAQLAETQPLAVVTKLMGDISAESSPRSDQSADKSGDSGISGDHGHSDHRLDSPRDIPDTAAWTPQQDLGDSSSDGAGGGHDIHGAVVATYSPGVQPFSLTLPRDQDKSKQLQQGFNSLQKLRKSVSGALGAALGSRRFDLEHEPMLEEPQQNWFLTKSAPNSLSNPLLYHQPLRNKNSLTDEKEESSLPNEKESEDRWRGTSYMSWGGHVMYLPPAPAAPAAPDQPLSIMGTFERPVRSKSSGCLEVAARAARSALAGEMRERERSASPDLARAVPARVEPVPTRTTNVRRGKRFTFQSTVRQLERRRLAEKLSREADLKEQQRKTELEAMRRVEEEFQRKRAREKANIRQQLRLVSSGANSMQSPTANSKCRDEPDGSCRASPAAERSRDARPRHSNASSEVSGRSKSSTPIRGVELSEWKDSSTRVYRDWGAPPALAHAHPPACARMPMTANNAYNEGSFSGSPVSDNYRAEWARGRSLTPRAPRLLPARSPASSTSGSELSLRPAVRVSEPETKVEEPAIVPNLRPTGPTRTTLAMH
ncbi:uncharacterized protein LOC121730043 [Aricia agestis]|uniref:uncharacterized protein LOC121730043 n=1 Tax=Aricia agestis TaxID=91739 RepID=UPI001C2049F3|nr:uncharacterized protein LOC121730043 [Aricia agestis]